MSWLSELKFSNRLEHLYAMIAGEEELDETVPSTYDRKQGWLYHIAQKIQGGTLPDASEASDGDVLTISDGDPAWAAPSGGSGGVEYVTFAKVDNTWTHDKSYSAILEAYNAGKVIVAVLNRTPSVMTAVVNGEQTAFVTTMITDPESSGNAMIGFTYWQIAILDGQTIVNKTHANWSN